MVMANIVTEPRRGRAWVGIMAGAASRMARPWLRQRTHPTHPLTSQFACTMAGGCQLPSPGGRIEGGSAFGQYRRITR